MIKQLYYQVKYCLIILFIDFFSKPLVLFLLEVTVNINGRIKELRKVLDLNQLEFSRKIGIKQTSLSLIETGKNNLTEQNIKLICMMFNVNEKWLRFGEGEIFSSGKKDNPDQERAIALFNSLMPSMQKVVIEHLEALVAAQKNSEKENE